MDPSDDQGNKSYSPWTGSSAEFMPKKKTPKISHGRGGVIAVFLFLALFSFAAYYFYSRGREGPNVGLEFSKPGRVMLGDPFLATITISNYSDAILKDAKISLFLPDGVSFLGQTEGQRVMEQAVGDLGPGSMSQQSFNLIVTQGRDTTKRLEARLGYGAPSKSSTRFESRSEADILVGEPAVGLTLEAPGIIFNGQNFDLQIGYANNTNQEFKNLRLKMDYPPIFSFKGSSMAAESGVNNSWFLGNLTSGSSGKFTITGSVIGPEKSFFNFGGILSADFLGETYILNSQSSSVAIGAAPLSLAVILGNGQDYAAKLGDRLQYVINYKNNSDVVMQNVTIRARLMGEMYDFKTTQAGGAFSSITNTLSWFAANTPALANLAPGQEGSVNFSVELKKSFPIRLLSDKNYKLKIDAQIESPTVPPNATAEKTISVGGLETKVSGKIEILSKALWRDAASGILNAGPYPPKVDQATSYTIHWVIINHSTDVGNVRVSAFLQSGSRFTGKVKSNMSTFPAYDPNSGLVVWQIPSIPAAKGIVGQPAEAVFQIENTPAVNQAGKNVPIVGETKIEAQDLFTNLTLQASSMAIDTGLPYDKTIDINSRTVRQ